ncbi:hypothetical protein [Flavobacterium sp. 102]|uniref:hypothetical protein n=1 Tax=Flavobacterium sp. 102 TaxID=2135623 RepID=UPI000EAD211D|nr:hypothetical protein [Flavobacterium sp. 102]RKS03260.1 hypothetical protein C8C84_3004 [Flavobacterium sp. 102]
MKSRNLLKLSLLFIGILLSGNFIFAQTKTEKETLSIDTDHAAITMEAKKVGSYLEVRVYNNHNITYNITFSTEVTLRGNKGEITKTLQTSGEVAPNKSNYAYAHIGEADPATTTYFSLENARNINFSAKPINTQAAQESTTNNHQNTNTTTTANSDPRPGANASVQELAAWQKRQYANTSRTSNNTSQNNYTSNNTATSTQNTSNNGVTQADLNDLLERNRQESNRILGLSPSTANKTAEQTAGDGIMGIADAWVKSRQEREEREEREEEKKRIRAENERIERDERLRKISNRSIIINKYQPKEIPLSSREKAPKLFYFIYAFDNANLNQEYGAAVYVSNVFEIGTFNDGTRAYTSTVKKEIEFLTKYTETLHGYYYTADEAEKLRQSFISLLQDNGVAIYNISYKGKPSTKKDNANSETNKKPDSKYGKSIIINDQNLAPAKINTSKPTEVPKRNIEKAEEEKKKSKYGKTIKIE